MTDTASAAAAPPVPPSRDDTAVAGAWRRLCWLDARLALRSVLRQGRRTAVALAAVAFGVIALLLAGGFIEWIFWGMRESTIRSQLGHVQVVRPDYHVKGFSDPFRFLLPRGEAELAALAQLPGVEVVAPRLAFSALLSHGDTTVSVIGQGVAPEKERLLSTSLTIVQGEALSEAEPKGVLVGRGLAVNAGLKVGDTVVFMANTASGGVNAVEGRVRGLFMTSTKAYDDTAVRLPLPLAQTLVRARGSHAWLILLKDTDATEDMVQTVRARYQDGRYQVVPWTELADFYNKTVKLFRQQVRFVELIIGLIIVLSISNTLSMSVMERTREIGTCMALGVPRYRILRQFLAEGLTLGVVGGLVGLAIGAVLAVAISAVGIPMPPPPGMDQGFSGEIRLTWALVTESFLLAVGTSLLASCYPAWKASRLDIIDALRHNR